MANGQRAMADHSAGNLLEPWIVRNGTAMRERAERVRAPIGTETDSSFWEVNLLVSQKDDRACRIAHGRNG
jgi:hypothetical protein